MYRSVLDEIRRVKPKSERENAIRLQSAERIEPYSSGMWNSFIGQLVQSDILYYPNQDRLLEKLAGLHELDTNNVLTGNGSDQLLKNIFESFIVQGDDVVVVDPTFPMYEIYAQLFGANVIKVPYKAQGIDQEAFKDALTANTKIAAIANPSSPVGDTWNQKFIEGLAHHCQLNDILLVIDEAYIEFSSAKSSIPLCQKHSNVIVTRTFSKALGSAGCRFGYGVSCPDIVNAIKKVKNDYEVSSISIKWIMHLLDNYDEVERYFTKVKFNKIKLCERLRKDGYRAINTECNWIYTDKLNYDPRIVVRQSSYPGSKDVWVRLCVPADETLVDTLLG